MAQAKRLLVVYFISMPRPAQRREIEIKLHVLDVAAIRKKLQRLHAREIVPRTHESNTLYDTPRSDLRRRGQLIRVRTEQRTSMRGTQHSKYDPNAILTYKGPAPPSARAKNPRSSPAVRSRFKIKEEAEVSLRGASEIDRILRALGLSPSFRYEKFRTTFALPGTGGVKIELDETPIGVYLELEGTVTGIDRAARLLGFARSDYRKDTYGALYLADCRRRGRKPGDMLFPPTKKSR